jgi:ribonuclease P protein component
VKDTIKSTDEISSLFKMAHRFTTGSFIALANRLGEECGSRGRIAFIAGKRLGTAPRRNRAKRLMREAARRQKAPWQNLDVVFIARDATVDATLDVVLEDMQRFYRHSVGKKG